MTPDQVASAAKILAGELAGKAVDRVCRPEPWSLALEMGRGRYLGMAWHPSGPALGLCRWRWPRGRCEEVLRHHLRGVRLEAATALPGEPVLRLTFSGGVSLVWESLGRSANALLLDEGDVVLWSGRHLKGGFRTGQPGTRWEAPPARSGLQAPPAEGFDAESYIGVEGPELLEAWLLGRGRSALAAELSRKARALARRREAVEGDRAEGARWAALEGAATGLLACGDLRRRGLEALTVWDHTQTPPREVEVRLDPSRTVLQNAEALFRKVRRGKARVSETAAILEAIGGEGEALEARRMAVASAGLGDLYPEGSERPRTSPRSQPRRTLPPGVTALDLPREFAGYAGKNARANDVVSFRLGRGEDFWFHAQDYPGCHVVVKNPRRLEVLPPDVELAAARHAAEHSEGPKQGRAGVMVSRCKHLRRVRGEPGKVMVASHRIVFVDLPDTR